MPTHPKRPSRKAMTSTLAPAAQAGMAADPKTTARKPGSTRPPASLQQQQNGDRLRRQIRALAADHGLTIAGLARRLGRPNANLFYNLFGKRSQGVSMATLRMIRDAFPGVTLDVLVGGDEPAGTVAEAGRPSVVTDTLTEPPEVPNGLAPTALARSVNQALAELWGHLNQLRYSADQVERSIVRTREAFKILGHLR